MPDFFQHARLPTLHHLADSDLAAREAELAQWAKSKPIALLLPAFAQAQIGTAPRDDKLLRGATYSLHGGIRIGLGSAKEGVKAGGY
mgnify:CR=1 FL=1